MASFSIELAKEGIPLPFGNKFWASNWPTGKSPLPGLIIHLIPSVSIVWSTVGNVLSELRVGYRNYWTAHERRVSLYFRCRRIPCSDHQLLRCHRMSFPIALSSFSCLTILV